VRYELQNGELAVFFTTDELNIALSQENALHRAWGISSGELMYACVVDSINERSGMPAADWRKTGGEANRSRRAYPESVETDDGPLVVRTLDGQRVEVS
jgi:hypothetical protein